MNTYSYRSSILLFIGILFSGLPGNVAVSLISPQPPWQGMEIYASNFHPVQMLPLWGGFIMLLGFISLIACIHLTSTEEQKLFTLLALASTIIYASLITLNYTMQLGVLQPALLKHQLNGMELLAFGNPHSVTMSIEMFGYGFQGAATLLITPVFCGGKLTLWIKSLCITNGIVSIAGLILQGLNIPMQFDNPFGFTVFVGWNVLFTMLCFLFVLYFKGKVRV